MADPTNRERLAVIETKIEHILDRVSPKQRHADYSSWAKNGGGEILGDIVDDRIQKHKVDGILDTNKRIRDVKWYAIKAVVVAVLLGVGGALWHVIWTGLIT